MTLRTALFFVFFCLTQIIAAGDRLPDPDALLGALSMTKTSEITQLDQLQPLYPHEESALKRVALLFINGRPAAKALAHMTLPWHQVACVIIADGGYRNYESFIKHHDAAIEPNLKPAALVGDLDSIKEEGLQQFINRYPNTPIHRFACAKDFTDFEAGLQMIDLNKVDQVYVIGAFGGRIDHTLANLCVLLRPQYCDKVYFIEGDELLLHSTKNSALHDEYETILPYSTSKEDTIRLCYQGKSFAKQLEAIRNFYKRSAPILQYEFGIEGNLLMDLAVIMHSLEQPGKATIQSSNERLIAIDPQNPVRLTLPLGKTLSLIPLKGPVKEIETQGLVWELHHGQLSAEFVGISNLVKSEKVEIAVGEGSLLCVLIEEAI